MSAFAKYMLIDGKVVITYDLRAWGEWMSTGDRVIEKTIVGDAEVSTVFLGLDHGFGCGRVLLFETLIFGGEHDGETWRYGTLGEAKRGHFEAVDMLREPAAADRNDNDQTKGEQ